MRKASKNKAVFWWHCRLAAARKTGYNKKADMRRERCRHMTNEELILQILGELKAGQDELRAGQASLTTRLEKVEAGQAKLETEMCHTRMLVEQQDHKISLVAEQYSSVAEKFDWLIQKAAQTDELRGRVSTLETVASHHTAELQALRKAN